MLTVLRSARDFRLLWLGQSASTVGDALVLVAVGLYVTRLTGDPSDVGVVLGAYSLPLVAFVLLGGVVADRLPRQHVMIASDVARCLLHATPALGHGARAGGRRRGGVRGRRRDVRLLGPAAAADPHA